jgi:protein associated with RNAse G/E
VFRKSGETVALRGVYQDRVTYVQSARVIKDTENEIILLVQPGAECAAPAGYIRHRQTDITKWDRWRETLENSLNLETYIWHTNRFLIFLEPEKYFSTIYIWEDASDRFDCYYINFQLPISRSHCGFDTFDLELDIIINPDLTWEWKDEEAYQQGIRSGGIIDAWVKQIEHAQKEVFSRIEHGLYPIDQSWLGWRPDISWEKTKLPVNWDKVIVPEKGQI